MEDVGPVAGDEDPDAGVPIRLGAEPHPCEEPRHICGGKGEAEEGSTLLNRDDPFGRRKRGHLFSLDGYHLYRRPGLGKRGAYDIYRHHHRLFIGAGAVEQDVLRRRRDPRQFTVNDGREGEDLVVSIDDQWEPGEPLYQVGIVPAFRVVGEDLIKRHLPIEVQRDERAMPGRGDVVEGRRDRVEVVDPDRHLASSAADRPVEGLLEAHQALNCLFIEVDVPDHR